MLNLTECEKKGIGFILFTVSETQIDQMEMQKIQSAQWV